MSHQGDQREHRGAIGPDWLLSRTKGLIRFRPLVYVLGLFVGAAAVGTARRELFWLMTAILLSPALAALVTRAARPKKWRFTIEGRIAGIFAVGFLAAALNTGTNLLYFLFAALLALLVVSIGASQLVFRGLFVRRRVPARVRALEPFEADVTVRNEKSLPAFALIVEEARPGLLAEKPSAFFPIVKGRQTGRGGWTARFTKRGDHALDGVALETRFPFGLIARRSEVVAAQQVLVLPAVFPLENELLARATSAEGVARRILMTEERRDVVRSLRDYRAGDHPRSIHWRASAHRGSLVVKDFEKTEPQRALVVLDGYGAEEGLLEDAISLAASLLVSWRERGLKTGLVFQSGARFEVFAPERGTSTARLHAALARLVPPASGELAPLAHQARRVAERARVVVVTTRSEAAAREGLAGLDASMILALEKPGDVARYRRSEPLDSRRSLGGPAK